MDKPYAAAGQDARSQGTSDWDGNNGCGNDDDREDDNNGWCGKKPDSEPDQQSNAQGQLSAHGKVGAQVLGVQFEQAAATTTATAAKAAAPATPAAAVASDTGRPAEVLGVQVTRGEALAATGVPIVALVLAGLALVFGGFGLRRMGRHRT